MHFEKFVSSGLLSQEETGTIIETLQDEYPEGADFESAAANLEARAARFEYLVSKGRLSKSKSNKFLVDHALALSDFSVVEVWRDPLISGPWTLVAVRKPFNALVRNRQQTFAGERTVEKWFAVAYPEVHMYPCHTLQDDVSGLLLVGTSRSVSQSCKMLFDALKVKKTYHALVDGHPGWASETRLDFPARGGRPITWVRVVRSGWLKSDGRPAALIEAWTMCGRAHQIETHLRKSSHPVIGEMEAGGISAYRLFLHLSRLDVPLEHHAQIVPIETPHGFDAELCNVKPPPRFLGTKRTPGDQEVEMEKVHVDNGAKLAMTRWGSLAGISDAEVESAVTSIVAAGSLVEDTGATSQRVAQLDFRLDVNELTPLDCFRTVKFFPECLGKFNPQLVWREGDLAVVSKPFNRLMYPKKRLPREVSLAQEWQNLFGVPGPRPCHRLDYGTSGALVIALTPSAANSCCGLFENRLVSKTYHALVFGSPHWEECHLTDTIQGKPSETFAKVLLRGRWAGPADPTVDVALVEAKPTTGRTHQIRIHLAGAGFPIVGDTDYGYNPGNDPAFTFRMFLHATRIELPLTSGTVAVEVPHNFESNILAGHVS